MKMPEDNDITIVTAFFDIGRGSISHTDGFPKCLTRTNETYFEYFSNLASLDNDMVIFTTPEHEKMIRYLRKNKPTTIILIDIFKEFSHLLNKIEQIQNDLIFQNKIPKILRKNIEYWNAKYVLVTNLKSYFVSQAVTNNLAKNKMVAWVDFGYVRNQDTLNDVKKWKYNFDSSKIHLFTIRKTYDLDCIEHVYQAIFNNEVFVIGGCIVASCEKWQEFYQMTQFHQKELMQKNIVDDDQGLILMCLFKSKDAFKLNYLGKNNWFSLFKKYDQTSRISWIEKLKDKFI